jgi:hypothetical protein
LILYGSFALGSNRLPNLTAADKERFAAMKTLMKLGWGPDDPTFRQIFTSVLMPTATREQADHFNEPQRLSGSPEGAYSFCMFAMIAGYQSRWVAKWRRGYLTRGL